MESNKRKKKYLATAFQKKLLFLVFVSAVAPAAIISACMYYLIFNMLAMQIVFPEVIAYNLIPVLRKVNIIIWAALPIILAAIWFVALEVSHRVAGPLYRMEKELDERIAGAKKGPITLRKNDELKLLAEKINTLLKRG